MKKLITALLLTAGLAGCCDCPKQKDYQPILEDIRAQLADIHTLNTIILGKLEE